MTTKRNKKRTVRHVPLEEHLEDIDKSIDSLGELRAQYAATLDVYAGVIKEQGANGLGNDSAEIITTLDTMTDDLAILNNDFNAFKDDLATIRATNYEDAYDWLPVVTELAENVNNYTLQQAEVFSLNYQTLLTYDY